MRDQDNHYDTHEVSDSVNKIKQIATVSNCSVLTVFISLRLSLTNNISIRLSTISLVLILVP